LHHARTAAGVCVELWDFPELSSFLTDLKRSDFPEVTDLPEAAQLLTHLEVDAGPGLSGLPKLPSSLTKLLVAAANRERTTQLARSQRTVTPGPPAISSNS